MGRQSAVPRAPRFLPAWIRRRIVRARSRFAEEDLLGLSVGLAHTPGDILEAWSLANRMTDASNPSRTGADSWTPALPDPGCGATGPTAPGAGRGRAAADEAQEERGPEDLLPTPHRLLPGTYTLLARRHGRIVGTASLVCDSPLGLPSEPLAAGRLERLRSRRRHVAELDGIAVDDAVSPAAVLYLLLKAVYRLATEVLGVDDLFVAAEPREADYFEACLCFVRKGRPRDSGCADPFAIPMFLDLRAARWTWYQTFGALPPGPSNTYDMFIARKEASVVMPESAGAAQWRNRETLTALVAAEPRLLSGMAGHLVASVLSRLGPFAEVPKPRRFEQAGRVTAGAGPVEAGRHRPGLAPTVSLRRRA